MKVILVVATPESVNVAQPRKCQSSRISSMHGEPVYTYVIPDAKAKTLRGISRIGLFQIASYRQICQLTTLRRGQFVEDNCDQNGGPATKAVTFTYQTEHQERPFFNLSTGVVALLAHRIKPFVNFRVMVDNEQFNNYGGSFGIGIEMESFIGAV